METATGVEVRSILHYFDRNLFCAHLKAQSKDDALRELTTLLADGAHLRDPELLLDMLHRREMMGSTGIGKGVAIPHGRSLAIPDLKLLVARSVPGVEFDAVDAKPVHLFFLIVAPPQDKRNDYLPLLGRIAELVKDRKVRERLKKIDQFDDLREYVEEQLGHE